MSANPDPKAKGKQRSVWSLVVMSVLMFGFAFALVPLYDVFCDITGINGKTSDTASVSSERVDKSREVTVEFVAYINPGVRWTFEPEVKTLVVNPGQTHTINYEARNLTALETIGQAVPSVSPGTGAKYFNKIECFCFNHQPLAGGETAKLPLVFYVDPELPDDINTLTLAYTLYNAKPAETAKTQ
ncbi:cytochrome c oxidase assembly protein [Photobacterium sanctipauli]|uniref:Cytochrome c oxidase assembly protein CtaG n=2 Tax=Photobacterium sanctipauli TaxID=1342794 RepID=A0A2T3NSY1_9GAMM|nr:cytochrome c oxidase assembly protein [Photobacterium sanctipauli]PSW19321.1 cytochrome c oxidase assembly protein [Photobacterium sanctipauli]